MEIVPPVHTTLYHFVVILLVYNMSRVAQTVQCLATSWTTEQSRFDPRQWREDFYFSLYVQNGSGSLPASYTMGTGGPFFGAKARPGRDADHSPHLVSRSKMSRSYTSPPPTRLRGV
jgi:hypothetical protein